MTADSERGNVRFSALWGKGGRGLAAIAVLVALMVPAAGGAHGGDFKAFVPHSLLSAAEANPGKKFDVIVQGQLGRRSDEIANKVANQGGSAKRQFRSITGVSATLPGAVILRLAKDSHILAITPDVRVSAAQEVLASVTTTTSATGPSASGGSASVSEDGSVSISLGGSSADSCELTFSIVSGPSHGTLGPLSGQLCSGMGPYSDSAVVTYSPASNFNGSDSFVYRVTNGVSAYADATVSIAVAGVNDAPAATDDIGPAPMFSGGSVTVPVLANDSDVDGDPLTVKLLALPANGMAVVNADSTVTYTAFITFVGDDSFTYVASDGKADSNVATVRVTVPARTDEDVPVSVALMGSSSTLGEMTFAIVTPPANGSLGAIADQTATGTGPYADSASVAYRPKANWSGTDSFVYRVTDAAGASVDKVISLLVNPVNDAPVAQDDSGEAGKPNAALANDSDVDGDPLSARIASQPGYGSAALNADGTISYSPSAGFVGDDSFTYVASDGKADSNVATVRVTVPAVTSEDVPVSIILRGSGTFSIATPPANGAAALNTDGTVTYTPKANWHGTDSYVYRVTDALGSSVDKKVSIVVAPVNDAPAAKDDTGEAGKPIAVLANDSDIDGDPLAARIVAQPGYGVAALNADGTITYTQKAGFVGNDSFTYVVSDGKADSNIATVSVKAPAAATDEDVPLAIALTGTSSTGGEMTFAIVTPPANGSLGAIAGQAASGTGPYADSASVAYSPKASWSGTDSFVYRVTDGAGSFLDATVSIEVRPVNDAPVAVNDKATAAWGTDSVTIKVLANDSDADGDALSVSLMPPANGTLVLNADNSVTYVAKLGFRGVDSFSYVVSDGKASSNPASVEVVIPADAEMWRQSTKVDLLWSVFNSTTGLNEPAPQAPAIAIVDSGVDASKVEAFGNRVVASVNLSSLAPGATGDDQGHGTMVASVAAGADPLVPGVAQNAPIVSIRTADANGQSVTSDVIAAADWILANAQTYRIRVANFSMAGSVETSFRFDPLNKAVERLWFSGIVVVAAAGNHGAGGPVSMSYAPANDPFIITVGALDQSQTGDPLDDGLPSWSGYGYTMDGFFKPDMAAPGRYMIMPVPANATIPATVPERVLAPGYVWMSGTSFSAPVVAGTAAQLLARHPEWTPDQVKGALMLSSVYLSAQTGAGVGVIDAASAASLSTPPNPNENLYPFVQTDSTTGQRYFNEANWASHVAVTANWSQANWASANWASANWASANWASANWSSANWSQNVESSMTTTANWNASALVE